MSTADIPPEAEEAGRELYDIAVVGMAGRFRDATDVGQLWRNLESGVESLAVFSDEELLAAGVDAALLRHPDYVKAHGMLEDAEGFDAAFFGIGPREAALRDPQHRLFLECAWEALENGGCDPGRHPGPIGVFGGCAASSYLVSAFLGGILDETMAGGTDLKLGNDPHFLTTFVSYWLDLKGPSVTVSTACSTSLVAVHLACQSLLQGECDAALAGGVAVDFPRHQGYLYQEGGINAPDGHCRAFDARGQGTVGGEGVGVVFLKRLRDALDHGDPIRALIKGSAINNDGRSKIGFTAPSIEGQSAVIAEAHAMAGIDAGTIGLVEAHGSGTPLGDPVEVRALSRAFRQSTTRRTYCALGSIKTNLGHLDSAAGVAGLIKAVLALEHGRIPPTLHFETPNPEIDFAASPFYVNAQPVDWPAGDGPRRAGVSSLGMGGTNAHVVLEEAPRQAPSDAGRGWQLLTLSAASEKALDSLTQRLRDHLGAHPQLPLADVAYTTQVGRRNMRHRRIAVCRDHADARETLDQRHPERLWTGTGAEPGTAVAFLFPGVGDHYPGMAHGLYQSEAVFRREIDRGAAILAPLLGSDPLHSPWLSQPKASAATGLDLRRMMGRGPEEASKEKAGDETAKWSRAPFLHAVVFLVEIALSRLWQSWGLQPSAVVGYSLGELAAATVAGVFSLPDALQLVVERGRAIEAVDGTMLAVPLAAADLEPLLGDGLALAAINAPELCVVSGTREAVAALEHDLGARGTVCRRLQVDQPLHGPLMEPVADALRRCLAQVVLKAPTVSWISTVPWTSTVAGEAVTPEQATDPAYWVRHLCQTVRFSDALAALDPRTALLEVGPGHGLTSLALQQERGGCTAIPSLRPVYEREDDVAFLLRALGRLWLAGVDVDWQCFHGPAQRRKVALPTYPFEHQRYSLLPPGGAKATIKIPRAERAEATPAPVPSATETAATASALEKEIAEQWRQLLRVERVGSHDSFFVLGGHSLLAPQVLLALRQRYGVEVPLAFLLERPTVAAIAGAVERLQAGEDRAALLSEQRLDLRQAVHLDPAIRPATGAPAGDAADPRAVLLTGASGFLGGFLLRDLLRHTRARVHCLVRATNLLEAEARILANLRAFGLWEEAWATRIVPLPGDLTAPLWGLPTGTFHALAHELDAVYHCGAWVNFTYPYSALANANVNGTVEALRLAALGRSKPLHFVSTVAVHEVAQGEEALWEATAPAPGDGPVGGYPGSKWVAEKLVEAARERGIPAVIYRPGIIGGDSASGRGNARDMVWSFLKGCLQMGTAPEVEATFDPAPVDFVSRALVHLSLHHHAGNGVFHLVNPHGLPWPEVFRFARQLGYPVRFQSWPAWRDELVATLAGAEENALRPFWSLLADALADERATAAAPEVDRLEHEIRFDCQRTLAALADTPIRCPAPDRDLLQTYFNAWQANGFLPPPPATTARPPQARAKERLEV